MKLLVITGGDTEYYLIIDCVQQQRGITEIAFIKPPVDFTIAALLVVAEC